MRYIRFISLLFTLTLVSCDGVFDVHPYDVNFDGDRDINANMIPLIEEATLNKEVMHVAIISDTHGTYSDTEDMIADINGRDSIDFVVHLGDLTNTATTKEFVWARDVLAELDKPYVALIGNHDFLGTGDETYTAMYGDMDFSFIAGRIKFVCINTNATEYDYMADVPDFDFLETQMTEDADLFDRTILCMHARPYSDQFNNNVAKAFEMYVLQFPGIMFCLNGHDHKIQVDDLFDDGIIYYGCTCSENRGYLLFTLTQDGYVYEVIDF